MLLFSNISCTTLFLRAPRQDRAEKLRLGQSSCISSNGHRLAFGASGFGNFQGALYIYDLKRGNGRKVEHWQRIRVNGNDTVGAEEKKARELRVLERGSAFGFSCAVPRFSEHVIVGAPSHSFRNGAVYIFARDKQKSNWYQKEKLSIGDQKTGDMLGWSVVSSADCHYIFVNAKGRHANNGEVYIFKCAEQCSKCELSQRIAPPDYTDFPGPRGIRIRNNFGISLACNEDGSILAVGCIGFQEERGAVYIFARVGETWFMTQRIESPHPKIRAFFGYKVSLDANGETLAVGADGELQDTGAVYMFARVMDKRIRFVHTSPLKVNSLSKEDNFGASIALSGDGRTVIAGAPGANRNGKEDHGVLYVFEEDDSANGNWMLRKEISLPYEHATNTGYFGWSVGLNEDGTRFVGSSPGSDQGSGVVAVGEYRRHSKKTGRKNASNRFSRTSQCDVSNEDCEESGSFTGLTDSPSSDKSPPGSQNESQKMRNTRSNVELQERNSIGRDRMETIISDDGSRKDDL